MIISPDLFGAITITKMWGGKDNKLNGMKVESYGDEKETEQAIKEVFKKREKRGYVLIKK